MHKPQNVSFDESLSYSTYERPARSSVSHSKLNKENHDYSYSSHNVSIKVPSNNPTFAANSPQCSIIHDSMEEIHLIPANKLADNFTFKKPLELRDTNKNKSNNQNYEELNESFDKSAEYQGNDAYLLKNEVSTLRKALHEAQIKYASIAKELSKSQHEYSLSQLQMRRSETRISELTESRTTEQAKVNELILQRNQLNKLRAETQDSTHKTKEDVETLRKNLADIESLVEIKNKNISRHARHLKIALNSLRNSIFGSEGAINSHSQDLFEKMQDIVTRILNLAGNNNTQEIHNEGDKSASSDYETSHVLKEMVSKYQTENGELKDHILYLDNLLQKEQTKNKELLPQYRESVDRLRKGAHILKEKLKETQQQRKEEKRQLNEKLREAEEANKSLVGDVLKYKDINAQLTGQIKHYELLAIQNEEKVQKLIKDHSRLGALVQNLRKNEEPYRRASRHEVSEESGFRPKKELRSLSKDYRSTYQTTTEGEETSCSRSFIPRSNSMTKGRPNLPKNSRDSTVYQRERSIDYAQDQSSKMSRTFSAEKGRNQNPFLTGSLEAERNKTSQNNKGFWQNSQGRISPSQGNPEGVNLRKASLNYQTQDRYESNHYVRDEEYNRNASDRKHEKSFDREEKEENESQFITRESDQENSIYGLKDEIASLDNEIVEIDRYMKEQLDTEDSTYI